MSKPFSKYNDLTVAELKEILKSKNLPVSGIKSILIDRLENSDINNRINYSNSNLFCMGNLFITFWWRFFRISPLV